MARNIKTKLQLLQYLIDFKKYKSYLEIGAKKCKTFNSIVCEYKVGVDPAFSGSCHQSTNSVLIKKDSNSFFKNNNAKFDIVFIDGLHLHEQVILDIINSWNCLRFGGAIVVHDCLPQNDVMASRERTTKEWTGDVWKAILWFRKKYPKIVCNVIDIDYGCAVIIKNSNAKLPLPRVQRHFEGLDFNWLRKNLSVMNIVHERKDKRGVLFDFLES